MIGEAHHHGVTVSDIEDSLAFYRDALGLPVEDRFTLSGQNFSRFVDVEGAEVEIVFFDAGGCAFEILDYRTPPGENVNDGVANNDVGAAHFCFEVDDVTEVYDDLSGEADFLSEPQTLESGAEVVYAEDPDGNIIEFLTP